MITTCLVRFPLPASMSAEEARQRFRAVAGDFQTPPGLLRKYFLLTQDGHTSVGIYVWETEEQALNFNRSVLCERIRKVYGVDPGIEVLETVVEVDNVKGQVRG